MWTSTDSHRPENLQYRGARTDDTADPRWSSLYRIGGAAALTGVALIPVQMVIFIAWPPPVSALGFYELFERSWLLGLLSLDLLYLLQNVVLILIYLSLCAALQRINASLIVVALALGLVGIAAYYSSNTAFEMLDLSIRYAAADGEAPQAALLAAGEGMLSTYVGTAFNVYYVLQGIALLIISVLMTKSADFGRRTAYVGILSALMMSIPSTAGSLGLIFSIASLLPWAVFSVLIARTLFQLSNGGGQMVRLH